MTADWDVLIVGRGFAGLSAALTLGRMRRSVLVVGTGGPRNQAVAHAHGLLTRDGANPNELIEIAESELAKYPTAEIVDAHVTSVDRDDDLFRVRFDRGTATASLVILATGVNDNPPPVPGLADHWGHGVYTCPFCDGYEHRDRPVAVVGDPNIAPHPARLLTAITDQVTVHAAVSQEHRDALAAFGIAVDDRPIVRVDRSADAMTLRFDDGQADVAAIFVAGFPHPNTTLAEHLGCRIADTGLVEVGITYRTSIDGVWAIGDVTTMQHQMSTAIAHGSTAGSDCVATLVLNA